MNNIIESLMDRGLPEDEATAIYWRDYYTPPTYTARQVAPLATPAARTVAPVTNATPMMRYIAPPPPDGITPNISGWAVPVASASPPGAVRPAPASNTDVRKAGRRTAAQRAVRKATTPSASAAPTSFQWSAGAPEFTPLTGVMPPIIRTYPPDAPAADELVAAPGGGVGGAAAPVSYRPDPRLLQPVVETPAVVTELPAPVVLEEPSNTYAFGDYAAMGQDVIDQNPVVYPPAVSAEPVYDPWGRTWEDERRSQRGLVRSWIDYIADFLRQY